jgi:hypothetical protein
MDFINCQKIKNAHLYELHVLISAKPRIHKNMKLIHPLSTYNPQPHTLWACLVAWADFGAPWGQVLWVLTSCWS